MVSLEKQFAGGTRRSAPIARNEVTPSPFVVRCLKRIKHPSSNISIDIASGYGRHVEALRARDFDVVCLDYDRKALSEILRLESNQPPDKRHKPSVIPLQIDLANGIPIRSNTIGLALAVQFPIFSIIQEASRVVAPGGYLVIETFGGQGNNWAALPKSGEWQRYLEQEHEILLYKERPVGPEDQNAVSVKAFTRKR